MAEHIRVGAQPADGGTGSLGELIHATIRRTIEVATHAELAAALGAARYARCDGRCGYRNSSRFRTLMRLVITAGPPDIWVGLEPETGEEAMALEACAARGEWTNGHGTDAIVRLQALAVRLGFPVTLA
jgi:hypothetical protein